MKNLSWPDTAIEIALIVLVMVVAWRLVVVASRRVVKVALARHDENRSVNGVGGRTRALFGLDHPRQVQRTKTLGSLLTSVAGFLILTIGGLMILTVLGLPMGPLLTSAGIGGVALGFGAQSLIKDFISGIFLIAEDQFGVGDVVDLGEVTGTVEEVQLRVTKLRDANGQVWYMRNGEILRVGNISQGWSNALVDISVSPKADPQQVIGIITEVATTMAAEEPWSNHLLEVPTVLGVESISGSAMTIRVTAKCVANEQWGVQRELRERSKVALDNAGIAGPQVPWTQR
ncbi:mechanosensitive ion channel family protein [Propionibacteriaceae bacterium G1746]|uniref:mechanosensitive ion channel family protein n=1 Tax=Aestuariimicrobium sp. G57 TaxID=3418485 RepID=UPI003C15E16D